MKSTLIKIPVVSFRKIASPYDEKGMKSYIAVVNIKNVPEELEEWRKLNPRDPKLNSGVSKKIQETLDDDPESFFFRNRGITMIAEKVELDNKENVMKLEMVDKEKNGLLDGGHTFRVIRKFVAALPEEETSEACVRIEILEGIKELDRVVDIVEARNTSTQVQIQGIEELRQHYEEIKKVLENKEYEKRIGYKEYEILTDGSRKDIDVKDLLSYLVCFDAETFDRSKHPVKTYSGKTAIVKYFSDQKERLKKYIPLLPKILELWDTIYLELPETYNKAGGKFGKLVGVRKKKTALPFIGKTSEYAIPSGFIYPALAAFRNLVGVKENKCEWKTDPIKLFEELKEELASRIGEQALQIRNPNRLGKDQATWGRCYDLVAMETLERNL